MNDKILKEAFSDDIEHYGMSSVRLTQSQTEKRTRLLAPKSELIERAADLIQAKFGPLGRIAFLDQTVLTRIIADRIDEDAHIIDGSVHFTCLIKSSVSRQKARIDISFPIERGKIRDTNTLKTSTGKSFLITEQGIKRAMGLHDSGTTFKRSHKSPGFSGFSAVYET